MMKTLNLSAEISSIALETVSQPRKPKDIIHQIIQFLADRLDIMGDFVCCQLTDNRHLDANMELEHYELKYEKRTLRFRFMFFRPRGIWQVQGFRFV